MALLTFTNSSQELILSKHHGLGNDFLIALNPTIDLGAEQAVRWCDRRTGFGADGLIIGTTSESEESDWTMVLYNSDGGVAEISGNGIRCLAQAISMSEGTESAIYRIETGGGLRLVQVESPNGAVRVSTVDMGPAVAGPGDFSGWDDLGIDIIQQTSIDIGNPHLVVMVADPEEIDLALVGPVVEGAYEHGINVHFVAVAGRDRLRLRVWERGAGITNACGSGACAAAAAANLWGLVGTNVRVEMAGGSALVGVGETMGLTGPAELVGWVYPIEAEGKL